MVIAIAIVTKTITITRTNTTIIGEEERKIRNGFEWICRIKKWIGRAVPSHKIPVWYSLYPMYQLISKRDLLLRSKRYSIDR